MTKRRDIIKTIKQAAKDAKLTFELATKAATTPSTTSTA